MAANSGAIRYGSRRKTAVAIRSAAASAPEQFKELVLPFLPELVEILIEDARDRSCIGHRTAVSGILDGLKITSSSDQLLEELLRRMNMPNESSLARASELYNAVGRQDAAEIYAEARKYIAWYEGPEGPGRKGA